MNPKNMQPESQQAPKRKIHGCVIVILILLGLGIVGVGGCVLLTGAAVSNIEKEKQDKIKALETATPSDLVPYGDLANKFNLMSEHTDIQRENTEKEITGQVVQWTLNVYEVKKNSSGYRVQTDMKTSVGTFIDIFPKNDEERSEIEALKEGDSISFRGYIDGVSLRHIEISPAVLIARKDIERSKIDEGKRSTSSRIDAPDSSDIGHNKTKSIAGTATPGELVTINEYGMAIPVPAAKIYVLSENDYMDKVQAALAVLEREKRKEALHQSQLEADYAYLIEAVTKIRGLALAPDDEYEKAGLTKIESRLHDKANELEQERKAAGVIQAVEITTGISVSNEWMNQALHEFPSEQTETGRDGKFTIVNSDQNILIIAYYEGARSGAIDQPKPERRLWAKRYTRSAKNNYASVTLSDKDEIKMVAQFAMSIGKEWHPIEVDKSKPSEHIVNNSNLAVDNARDFVAIRKTDREQTQANEAKAREFAFAEQKRTEKLLQEEALKHQQEAIAEAKKLLPELAKLGLIRIDGGIVDYVRDDQEVGYKKKKAVTVDSFYIYKTETAWNEWNLVLPFAQANGYDVDDCYVKGEKLSQPARNISWLQAVKWCNARSEIEGLKPVYEMDGSIFKSGKRVPTANESANGYRLPTILEWLYAATDGNMNSQERLSVDYWGSEYAKEEFSWGIGHSSHEVRTKRANKVGMHDMVGNVGEYVYLQLEEYRYFYSGEIFDKTNHEGTMGVNPKINGVDFASSHNQDQVGFRVSRSIKDGASLRLEDESPNLTKKGGVVELPNEDSARKPATAPGPWLIADSSQRRLTNADLAGLNADQLWRARNEIYARNGLIFSTTRGRAFVDTLGDQYRGTDNSQEGVLGRMNEIEKANVEMIKKLE